MSLRDWTKQSGAFVIKELSADDTVLKHLKKGTKYLECTTAGSVAIPVNKLHGTYEFDIFPMVGSYSSLFLGTSNLATTGYSIDWGYRIRLHRYPGPTPIFYTAPSFLMIDTWYSMKVLIDVTGKFTVLIKGGSLTPTAGYDGWTLVSTTGGSGSNPVTDTTYNSINYIVLQLLAGAKIANIKFYDGVRQ